MKYLLILFSFILLISCNKQSPILSGKVTFISTMNGEKSVGKKVTLDLYKYIENLDYSQAEFSKSLYRTTTNEKGKYRIENLSIGVYLVVVQNPNNKKFNYKKIEITKNKIYRCDFSIDN